MAELLFFDSEHEYHVGEEIYPSVSEIIRFLSREEYDSVNQYNLDNAAERGKLVHKATESIDKYGSVEAETGIAGYVRAYVQFLKDHNVQWEHIEHPMYHATRKYAGTLDREGIVDGKRTLLDIKTNGVIKKALVKAQLNGYEDMRQSNGYPASDQLICLQLMANGKYRLYPCEKDMTEFDACYVLHAALKKKQERGRIL